ncbi:MAG: hypothetical protein AB1631_07270 [Acidobacteriota bacterium]
MKLDKLRRLISCALALSLLCSGGLMCLPIPSSSASATIFSADFNSGATFASGMVGQASSFDGVDDYVSVADAASLRAIGAITIDFWARFDRVPPHETI